MGVRKMVVVPSFISTTLTDFPLIVKMDDEDIGSVCESDGSDIVFYDTDNNIIPFERDSFAISSGKANGIWVLKRTCSATPHYIYVRAGFGDSDQEDATAVWGTTCKLRLSMDEASGLLYDSTSNAHNMTASGSPTYGVTAKVGKGVGTAGGFFYVADHPDWDLSTNDLTLSLWIYANSWGYWWERAPICQDEGPGDYNKWFFSYDPSTGKLIFHLQAISPGEQADLYSSVLNLATGVWHHIAVTRSGTTFTFYHNGVAVGTATDDIAVPSVAAPLRIGWGENPAYTFDGSLDDLVFYNGTCQSADWMLWRYLNSNYSSAGLAILSPPSSRGSGSLIDGGLVS
ncbi:LamG domain-containing protein [Candidatus Pacearchaeota archaeon]|jgi:hypothetical protein|nr:LamG domain-containing protein [Candidatus Pacearchaeota archaeon]